MAEEKEGDYIFSRQHGCHICARDILVLLLGYPDTQRVQCIGMTTLLAMGSR